MSQRPLPEVETPRRKLRLTVGAVILGLWAIASTGVLRWYLIGTGMGWLCGYAYMRERHHRLLALVYREFAATMEDLLKDPDDG